jgi:hypothetical protein
VVGNFCDASGHDHRAAMVFNADVDSRLSFPPKIAIGVTF